MTRPRIALTVSASRSLANERARERYVRALTDAGADVVVCEPGTAVPDDVAGIVLSGGGDVSPERYGETDTAQVCEDIVPERDELELAAARRALAADIPVLAICRGFQVLNVALGGSLVQHLDGHRPRGDEVVEHVVSAEPGSKLALACTDRPMRVNSRHHQAVTVERLAPPLRATVLHDGIVEAFESPAHRWVVGVQWHPERSLEVDEPARRIFGAFVAEASRSLVA
ncbi:MAG TPA: gamma-glutamyl-gamma-aminobutyrate hydrolase family protein [Candidatus Limnocylindria bacterium]